MKYSFYPLLGLALFVASCTAERTTTVLHNTTLEGSIDYGKAKESGNSAITYDSKTGENIVVTTEIDLEGENMNRYRQDDALRDDDPKPAGGDAGGHLGLRYGLGYVGKGAKFPGGTGLSIHLNYLEVPIDVMYHYPAGPGEFRGGLGPYFAYGIGGKSGGISSFGQNNGGFKHFDAGLNFRAGYKLSNGVSLDLGYDLGLTNVEYASEDVSGHTRTFSINVGYQIGKLFAKK
jgi:hypothetical protein